MEVNDDIRRLQYDIISMSGDLLGISQRIESIENDLRTELNDDIKSLLDAIRNISARILDYESSSLQEYRRLIDKFITTGVIVEGE